MFRRFRRKKVRKKILVKLFKPFSGVYFTDLGSGIRDRCTGGRGGLRHRRHDAVRRHRAFADSCTLKDGRGFREYGFAYRGRCGLVS